MSKANRSYTGSYGSSSCGEPVNPLDPNNQPIGSFTFRVTVHPGSRVVANYGGDNVVDVISPTDGPAELIFAVPVGKEIQPPDLSDLNIDPVIKETLINKFMTSLAIQMFAAQAVGA